MTKQKKQHETQNKAQTRLTSRNIFIISACFIAAFAMGVLSDDLIIGGSLFAAGLVGSYLASLQRRSNYIFSLINAVLIAYVGFINGLYGSFMSNIFIFAPLEIYGFVAWGRHLNTNKDVKIRELSRKNSTIIMSACVIGSIAIGYLLSKIPTQRMAFLDAIICCIDICALVIMNLRYRESWWLWVISGILSIFVWATALIGGGQNALMRLMFAIGFLAINTYGAVRWGIKLKKRKHH